MGEKGSRARWCCPGVKKQREELNREAERKSRCFVLALPHSRLLPSRSEAIGIRRRKRTPNDPRGSVFDFWRMKQTVTSITASLQTQSHVTRKDALPFKESRNSRKTNTPPSNATGLVPSCVCMNVSQRGGGKDPQRSPEVCRPRQASTGVTLMRKPQAWSSSTA